MSATYKNSFHANMLQKVRQTIARPLQGNVLTQMCAICAHHLSLKHCITHFRGRVGDLLERLQAAAT